MTALVTAYPQYLGIGLDEATAIVVRGGVATVEGRGKAHFFDPKKKAEKGKPDYESLADGARYDLEARGALPAKGNGKFGPRRGAARTNAPRPASPYKRPSTESPRSLR